MSPEIFWNRKKLDYWIDMLLPFWSTNSSSISTNSLKFNSKNKGARGDDNFLDGLTKQKWPG